MVPKCASIAFAGVLSACADNQVCESGCPDVAGTYALTTSAASSSCAFEPYLLPPMIELEQEAGSGQVETTLIDPVQQLDLTVSGSIFSNANGDDPELLASFRFATQPLRQATPHTADLTRFEVLLTGSVFESEGVRHLSGQLVQVQIDEAGSSGCSVSQSFTGLALVGTF